MSMRAQGEVFNGAILQQAFSIEYVVADQPCTDCNRHAANPNVWVAAVQVRGTARCWPKLSMDKGCGSRSSPAKPVWRSSHT